MTQKDKVKELVGRGLHSYHTKSLQQIDRIEKKNKEQNHKISILSNELDNDYLTKTEEGSVISLEHSKEGMIYLDELQGNTLVNYCTDGSKELTLNGDIDVEGTFVTTTEGVDNGKVDVMCEGNTLINLVSRYTYHANQYSHVCFFKEGMLKPSIKYSAIILNPSNEDLRLYWNENIFDYVEITIPANSTKVFTHTTKAEMNIDEQSTLFKNAKTHTQAIKFKVILLEGDWSNKELPNDFFEGMKSVGQDDTNGHKIEILSRNKNLFDINSWKDATVSSGQRFDINNNTVTILGYNSDTYTKTGATGSNVCSEDERKYLIEVKPNTTYTLSMEVEGETSRVNYVQQYNENYANLGLVNYGSSTNDKVTFTTKPNCKYVGFRIGVREAGATLVYSNILLEEGSQKTNYVNYNTNKKEILLNEPLRGLPSGVKDYFIKQGGKWYIQRNVGEYIFKGNEINSSQGSVNETNLLYWNNAQSTLKNKTDVSEVLSNKLPHGKQGTSNTKGIEGISFNGKGQNLLVDIKKTMTETNEFLKDSKIIYQLETPTYEEITDPTLITYLDTTHISNNSTIPCNMKIKNSGYNAIIKPSTLYTVALDTNKSGTIGINLGGAKVTTTNNVASITTPATLTDDSLRLYGKGIKGSKVRLLEGDKTNWIPSYFEGMKSSFEDKFDATDNTYKMEILSNNKNLINIKDYNKNSWGINISYSQGEIILNGTLAGKDDGLSDYYLVGGWDTAGDNLNLKPNTRYTFSGNIPDGVEVYIIHKAKVLCGINSGNKISTWTNGSIRDVNALMVRVREGHTFSNTRINIQIEEGSTSTTSVNNIYNKIQFSSIEPLRSLPSGVKDKFIFKDGKLMIERNTSKTKITSDMNIARSYKGWANIVFACEVDGLIPIDISTKNVYCNLLPSFSIADLCNTLGKTGIASHSWSNKFLQIAIKGIDTVDKLREWISERDMEIVYQIEPTYEEIPFELQKIILEGYENGTLFFDTNIPPTSTVTYAGETPIVKSVRLNKTEVLNNTTDINDNIIPYLMDMDYRVVCLELATETQGISMARLFGGVYEMLKRDILSRRYSVDEYKHRLDVYLGANKITEDEYNKLGDMLNE